MNFLAKVLLGNGRLRPRLRAELESEGLVLIEEGLPGSVRYRHFKAPGRRYHGKVTLQRFGLGISEKRFAVYCRSGRAKLINTAFSEPRLRALEVSLEGTDRVVILIDYDKVDVPNISGEVSIEFKSPNAATIVEQLTRGLGRR